jgi:hypothetical protein
MMRIVDQSIQNEQFPTAGGTSIMPPMSRIVSCVLMRAGTSRGPFFPREWLPRDDVARDEALIGTIGASDFLQRDGVGGGSTPRLRRRHFRRHHLTHLTARSQHRTVAPPATAA